MLPTLSKERQEGPEGKEKLLTLAPHLRQIALFIASSPEGYGRGLRLSDCPRPAVANQDGEGAYESQRQIASALIPQWLR